MTYEDLIAALKSTGIPFAEGGWQDANKLKEDYGVYAIDGRRDLLADNAHEPKVLEGTIDLFALHSKGMDKVSMIEWALDSVGAAWRLNAGPIYESGTGYTHWEWVFNVLPELVR